MCIIQKDIYKKNQLKRMKILVIGLGSMGKRRIRCMKKLGFTKIIGLDPRKDRRTECENVYGVKTFSAIDDALSQYPDCMIISAPPNLHYKYALIAIKNNIHFFTEVNLSSKEVSSIIKKLENKTIVGIPSSTLLSHPMIKKLQILLKERKIGKPLTIYHHFGNYLPNWHPWEDYRKFYAAKKETGAAKEIVPFELVWLTHIFKKINAVTAIIKKVSELETKIDDIYQIFIEFQNKVLCTLIIDVISEPSVNETKIIGDNGIIHCDYNSGIIKIGKGNKWKEVKVNTGKIAPGYKENVPSESTYVDEMRDFVNAIKKKTKPRHTFFDEFLILQVLDAIEESNKKSKKIIISKK